MSTSDWAGSSRPVLYTFPASNWSRAARFAANDLGYLPELIDERHVNLDIGEEYKLSYLRLNPNGTVPTLVIPPNSPLNPEGTRELVLTDSKDIIHHLSLHARTPNPASPPLSAQILHILRDPNLADPRSLARGPRDEEEFRRMAPLLGTIHIFRQDQLEKTLKELQALQSSGAAGEEEERIKAWVENKLVVNQKIVDLWTEQDPQSASRQELFKRARLLWGSKLPVTLQKLEELLVGPFCAGEELCEADYTLGSWLERIVQASGGGLTPAGLEAVEAKVGAAFSVPPKVRRWWELMLQRPSFRETFGVKVEDGVAAGMDALERQITQLSAGGKASNVYTSIEPQ